MVWLLWIIFFWLEIQDIFFFLGAKYESDRWQTNITIQSNFKVQNTIKATKTSIFLNKSKLIESKENDFVFRNSNNYFIYMDSSKILLENTILEGGNQRGGVLAQLSVIFSSVSSFQDCFGLRGGAFLLSGNTDIFISEGEFKGNNASEIGGAIYSENGNLNISLSRFEGNTAEQYGSDIFAS